MEEMPVKNSLPMGKESVRLEHGTKVRYRGFAVFLICCGLLLAAFAVSSVWMRGEGGWFDRNGGLSDGMIEEGTTGGDPESSDATDTEAPNEAVLPEGATPVRTEDLSGLSLGRDYIHNETDYRPDVEALLKRDVSMKEGAASPKVLILHTHTGESYLPAGTSFLTEPVGDLTYSRESSQNVLAVGEVLCRTLNEKGITALHCAVMHDDPTLSGAYTRSADTVRSYLERYPTIEYVIDLHRDAVITSDGAYIRAATGEGDNALAQVMAVVGSDGNGTPHDAWESNLALALQLREQLNQIGEGLCRPVSLRNASFNQELARHSILLEIGTGANSIEEAKRSAVLVGNALAQLLLEGNG